MESTRGTRRTYVLPKTCSPHQRPLPLPASWRRALLAPPRISHVSCVHIACATHTPTSSSVSHGASANFSAKRIQKRGLAPVATRRNTCAGSLAPIALSVSGCYRCPCAQLVPCILPAAQPQQNEIIFIGSAQPNAGKDAQIVPHPTTFRSICVSDCLNRSGQVPATTRLPSKIPPLNQKYRQKGAQMLEIRLHLI
jgi:hypothetical protein